ncbi:hypothetical protein GGR54DRAFT_302503 [Hypoxylon sp. NC1633]|nr:hypothetical protein GGR54DRAFT_302503 [Hypoxylon sp. NC1633]
MHISSAIATVLPLAAAVPATVQTRASYPNCQSASSNNFEWTVENFEYHASYIYSTPAHQIASGAVHFNLTNPALDYQAICSATSTQLQLFFYGNIQYTCTVPNGSTTKTTFDFNKVNGELNVNQTWTCNDAEPATNFSAYGSVNLTEPCVVTTWQNPNWTQGEIYSDQQVDCTPLTIALKPYKVDISTD